MDCFTLHSVQEDGLFSSETGGTTSPVEDAAGTGTSSSPSPKQIDVYSGLFLNNGGGGGD